MRAPPAAFSPRGVSLIRSRSPPDKPLRGCGFVYVREGVCVCLRSGVYDLVQAKARFNCEFITLQFRSYFHSEIYILVLRNISNVTVERTAEHRKYSGSVAGYCNVDDLGVRTRASVIVCNERSSLKEKE